MEAAIRTAGLHKHFGAIRAVDGLDMSVAAGAVYGFLGPNGAGKTTTLRMLTGLAHPTAGQAWIDGVAIGHGEYRHRIGYLPDVPAFYGWMTPREYLVDLVAPIFHLKPAEARQRAEELLALAGLTGAAKRRIGGFSRGMKQRLGIAQALLHRPPILLLDEPVSALDPAGRYEVLEMIAKLRGEMTILMSTHILADVERVCDTVGIIHQGKLIVQAGREELLARYAQPVVEVEFDAPAEQVKAWAERIGDHALVRGVSLQGRQAHLAMSDGEDVKVVLPGLIAQSGLPVQRYQWARPSLEDVFLQLVGE